MQLSPKHFQPPLSSPNTPFHRRNQSPPFPDGFPQTPFLYPSPRLNMVAIRQRAGCHTLPELVAFPALHFTPLRFRMASLPCGANHQGRGMRLGRSRARSRSRKHPCFRDWSRLPCRLRLAPSGLIPPVERGWASESDEGGCFCDRSPALGDNSRRSVTQPVQGRLYDKPLRAA